MGMLELVVRSRLGRDGFIRTSSSLVTHTIFAIFYFLSSHYAFVENHTAEKADCRDQDLFYIFLSIIGKLAFLYTFIYSCFFSSLFRSPFIFFFFISLYDLKKSTF